MATANEASLPNILDFNMQNAEIVARDIGCGNINGQNIQLEVHNYKEISAAGSTASSDDVVTKVISWLSPYSVDYFPIYEKARSQRAEHTGKWFFDSMKYKLWSTVGFGKYRNLECVAGAGKTTLAATVTKSLQDGFLAKRGLDIVLYAYFRHNTQAKQNIPFVLASLLLQLIKRKRKVSTSVRRFYEDYSSHKDITPATDAMITLLRSELSGFGRAYIIVDALDEFSLPDYSPSFALVEVLNARLLITSRYGVGYIPNTFLTLPVSAHADDIRIFVRKHLSGHLANVVARNPGLLEIVDGVVTKSAGMFVVAQLLVSCIPKSQSLTANDIRTAVKELPTGIEDTYKLAIRRIQDQEPHLAELGNQALYWVYFSKRRLTVMELCHAVSFQRLKTISEDDLIGEDRMHSACAGLITFVKVKDKRKTVECQFSHFTTREFLDKYWRKYFPDGKRKIRETCSRYLMAVVSDVLSELTEDTRLRTEEEQNTTWKQFGDDHGLAMCAYAAEHLGFAPNTLSALHDISIFVRKHLAAHKSATVVAGTPGLLEEIERALVMKSDGVFIVAAFLVSCIPNTHLLTSNEVRAVIEGLPTGKEDIYKMFMACVLKQEPHIAELALQVLCWVYFSKRRLTAMELRHALSFQRFNVISQNDLIGEDLLLSACAGLITFVKLEDKSVVCQFQNFTTREFFDRSWWRYFAYGERQITETCLEYLADAVADIPQHIADAARRDSQNNHVWERYRRLHGFALCPYAAEYWSHHARAIKEVFNFDAGANFFRHPISPYLVDVENTGMYADITTTPTMYWIRYFAEVGLFKLKKHIEPALSTGSKPANHSGLRGIHFAALRGYVDAVESLLDSGVNVNLLYEPPRWSPLHFAVQGGGSGLATVQLLLDRGAIMDHPSVCNRAPISYAIQPKLPYYPGSPEIVRLLLQRRPNIYRYDLFSETPLSLAQRSEKPEIKQLLKEYARTGNVLAKSERA